MGFNIAVGNRKVNKRQGDLQQENGCGQGKLAASAEEADMARHVPTDLDAVLSMRGRHIGEVWAHNLVGCHGLRGKTSPRFLFFLGGASAPCTVADAPVHGVSHGWRVSDVPLFSPL